MWERILVSMIVFIGKALTLYFGVYCSVILAVKLHVLHRSEFISVIAVPLVMLPWVGVLGICARSNFEAITVLEKGVRICMFALLAIPFSFSVFNVFDFLLRCL
jgi:hypothetical protein